ncbi:50S ribosomal protein L11 methyltransferase [Sedimentibacter sp. zth1]|uniref:50S ribosomal protein L11 methyltransferase n=1 Tax=Sedimentibacter sp. zth1 TaxID=2816908 RepID=UPI001A90F11B|nr:50S ribosomal protein L11 methyltransferase [Sedimentibacter sp. zth1]QSX06619.1 50S ribosomal protein L11 methyltransferase [Sedimentibacter sp. zth1]
MKFNEIIIETTSQGLEILNAILLKLDITEVIIEDASVFEEFLESKTMNWDYYDESLNNMKNCPSRVKLYLNEDEQGEKQLLALKSEIDNLKNDSFGIDMGSLNLQMNTVNDEDWANNWKQFFKPFEVGKHIIIKPTWETVENDTDRVVLEIDPGASFGTGQHFTTQLCIEQIEKYIKKDMKILDMGCGSGILSIASILLGAKNVVGVDIDENAVRIARENALVNGIHEDKFTTYCGNVIEDERLQDTIGYNQYDMIAVNIIADIIIAMSDSFPKFLKQGGILVTSGIIEKYVDKVKETLKNIGFEILETRQKEDWVSITALYK